MKPTPHDRDFIRRFNAITGKYADDLREWLPYVIAGGEKGRNAKFLLFHAAATATKEANHAAGIWIRFMVRERVHEGKEVVHEMVTRKSVAAAGIGQRSGIALGVRNDRLIARLEASLVGDVQRITRGFGRVIDLSLMRAKLPASLDKRVTAEIAAGQLEKQTLREIQKRVWLNTGLSESNKVVLSNGSIWDAEKYTKMLVRTRTREATNDSILTEWKSQGGVYVRTSEHTGVDPKDICYALQGKVWALSDGDPLGFPTLPSDYGPPPWHPNCSHFISPWVAELHSEDEIQSELGVHATDSAMMSLVMN